MLYIGAVLTGVLLDPKTLKKKPIGGSFVPLRTLLTVIFVAFVTCEF